MSLIKHFFTHINCNFLTCCRLSPKTAKFNVCLLNIKLFAIQVVDDLIKSFFLSESIFFPDFGFPLCVLIFYFSSNQSLLLTQLNSQLPSQCIPFDCAQHKRSPSTRVCLLEVQTRCFALTMYGISLASSEA